MRREMKNKWVFHFVTHTTYTKKGIWGIIIDNWRVIINLGRFAFMWIKILP
jgi:hypothetical protein